MSAISTTFVVVDPLYPLAPALHQINSYLRHGVTSSPGTALFIAAVSRLLAWTVFGWLALTKALTKFPEAIVNHIPAFVAQLPVILYQVLTHTLSLIQTLLLHPFLEIRRSVYGHQIFWEYASVTFSLFTSWATANSLFPTRVILERVMPTEQWALLMLMVGVIQFLVIPLGSNRARAVACVLALVLWLPLVLIFMRRAGILGPVPGYIVFAFGNYLHIFSLLRTPPGPP
jgi:hypothetical protein